MGKGNVSDSAKPRGIDRASSLWVSCHSRDIRMGVDPNKSVQLTAGADFFSMVDAVRTFSYLLISVGALAATDLFRCAASLFISFKTFILDILSVKGGTK